MLLKPSHCIKTHDCSTSMLPSFHHSHSVLDGLGVHKDCTQGEDHHRHTSNHFDCVVTLLVLLQPFFDLLQSFKIVNDFRPKLTNSPIT